MTPTEIEQLQIVIIDDEMRGVSQRVLVKSLMANGILEKNIHVYPSGPAYEAAVNENALSLMQTTLYFVDYHLKDNEKGPTIINAIRKRESEQNLNYTYICGWSSDEVQSVRDAFITAGANHTISKQTNKDTIKTVLDNASLLRNHSIDTASSSSISDSPQMARRSNTEGPAAHFVEEVSNPVTPRHTKPSLFAVMCRCLNPVKGEALHAKP